VLPEIQIQADRIIALSNKNNGLPISLKNQPISGPIAAVQ
jgi:hypothetical protein